MQDVYRNTEEHNLSRKCIVLIVFDDMTADMISSKNLSQIITEIFIRGRKLNISTFFITKSYFQILKNVRLSCLHCFIMNISNKRELQQIAFNHLSDIGIEDFTNLHKK